MDKCRGKTKKGIRCNKVALESGYCYMHDPEIQKEKEEQNNIINKKKEPLDNVLSVIIDTCKNKGWLCRIEKLDENEFKSATISVKRTVPSGFITESITAIIELHFKDKTLEYSIEKTSFHSYGINALKNAISSNLEEKGWITSKRKKSNATEKNTTLEILLHIFKRFHVAAQQLLDRHENRETIKITDEYDVQDILHAFLKLHFNDVRPEEFVPSNSGANSRLDFLLKEEKIVIEVKIAATNLKDKKISEQLIVDKQRYKSHPDCKKLFCFVYDPEYILKNPYGLETDLSELNEELEFRVFIYPK